MLPVHLDILSSLHPIAKSCHVGGPGCQNTTNVLIAASKSLALNRIIY